jgi:hypothetical protein
MGEPPDCEGVNFVRLNTVDQLNGLVHSGPKILNKKRCWPNDEQTLLSKLGITKIHQVGWNRVLLMYVLLLTNCALICHAESPDVSDWQSPWLVSQCRYLEILFGVFDGISRIQRSLTVPVFMRFRVWDPGE